MSDKKQADRIVFQTSKHHREVLRGQIDTNFINQIQIDKNPSLNYKNAYRNLYHDELQKTVQLHEVKKQKQKHLGDEDRFLYTIGMKQERPPQIDQTNMTSSQLSKIGQRYIDYHQQLVHKKQNHVQRNYDGGQAFYRAHDQHLRRRQNQAVYTNQTLHDQLQQKQQKRYLQRMLKTEQNQAFNQFKHIQSLHQHTKLQEQKLGKQAFRQNMVVQMQQQRQKRHRKSKFSYQGVGRHNPITNPIQYHIDNPYILRQIQNRGASQSVYQGSMY